MIENIEKSISKSWTICSSSLNGGKEIVFSTFVDADGHVSSLLKIYINTHNPRVITPVMVFSTTSLIEAYARYNALEPISESHALHAIDGAIS